MADDDNTKSSSTTKYEPFTPYYLHPSEGTGSVISPILLNGRNYDEWVRSLRNNLRAKNKLGFVDGTIEPPDSKSPDFEQWGIVNSMLVAWIFNTLDVSIRKTVPFPDDVKVLWDDLRERYSQRNGSRVHELKIRIGECKQRERSVSEYYGELRTLWDELASAIKLPTCTCSAAGDYNLLLENEKLHQFLIGLDSSKYKTVVEGLLMMDPLPSLSYAHGKCLAAERHLTVVDSHASRVDTIGFAVDGQAVGRVQGKLSGGSTEPRSCTHCGRKGHDKDRCFELVGWPERYNGRGRGNGGRWGRGGGGQNSGRGRGNFAAATDGTRQAVGSGGSNDIDRTSVPTLTDSQFQQLVAALKTSTASNSTPKLHGPEFEEPDWSGGTV